MFSRTIFGQTLQSNYKMWLILTLVSSGFHVLLVAVFDTETINSMAGMTKGTALGNILGNTSFLGMLSQTYFSIHGVLLGLIYVIATAGSLIVAKVDKGSMAYLLSAPITRGRIVRTQAAYLILMVMLMFTISTTAGLLSVEAFHGGVFTKVYTDDVEAAAEVLNADREEIANDLNMILDNDEALKAGARARELDEEEYTAYLHLKISNNALEAAADEMGVDAKEIQEDPSMMKDNEKAAVESQSREVQDKVLTGIAAASDVLDMEESDLIADPGKLKTNALAYREAVKASGLSDSIFGAALDGQIAANAVAKDKGIDFKIDDYLMLNLGLFLLMFATGGISFLFSCIFNLSKNYFALGAGIPFAFFLFHMMAQVSDNLEGMKYLTMNTLFDTQAIIKEESCIWQFLSLAAIGIVLYAAGVRIFVKKDLPI